MDYSTMGRRPDLLIEEGALSVLRECGVDVNQLRERAFGVGQQRRFKTTAAGMTSGGPSNYALIEGRGLPVLHGMLEMGRQGEPDVLIIESIDLGKGCAYHGKTNGGDHQSDSIRIVMGNDLPETVVSTMMDSAGERIGTLIGSPWLREWQGVIKEVRRLGDGTVIIDMIPVWITVPGEDAGTTKCGTHEI